MYGGVSMFLGISWNFIKRAILYRNHLLNNNQRATSCLLTSSATSPINLPAGPLEPHWCQQLITGIHGKTHIAHSHRTAGGLLKSPEVDRWQFVRRPIGVLAVFHCQRAGSSLTQSRPLPYTPASGTAVD